MFETAYPQVPDLACTGYPGLEVFGTEGHIRAEFVRGKCDNTFYNPTCCSAKRWEMDSKNAFRLGAHSDPKSTCSEFPR